MMTILRGGVGGGGGAELLSLAKDDTGGNVTKLVKSEQNLS